MDKLSSEFATSALTNSPSVIELEMLENLDALRYSSLDLSLRSDFRSLLLVDRVHALLFALSLNKTGTSLMLCFHRILLPLYAPVLVLHARLLKGENEQQGTFLVCDVTRTFLTVCQSPRLSFLPLTWWKELASYWYSEQLVWHNAYLV